MPELVEAEVCAAQLNVALWHAKVAAVSAYDRTMAGRLEPLVDCAVEGVVRAGNAVLFEMRAEDGRHRYLMSRFGASGSWRIGDVTPRRALLLFYGARAPVPVAFVNCRRGGGASLEVADSLRDLPYMRYIATTHDVMSDRFDDLWLTSVFSRCPSTMTARQALVRPEFFPGVGPWIANEALFRAGVAPRRPARSLEPGETAELARGVILVVSSGVVRGGAAVGAWRNPDGTRGRAAEDWCVHGRAGEACLVCGAEVRREKAPGGASFWCPSCQR